MISGTLPGRVKSSPPIVLREPTGSTVTHPVTQPAARGLEEVANERHLVARACTGDGLAFRAIVERHHRGMYGLAARMLRDEFAAEDVVQEAFARAYRKLDTFDPRYRLSTWLYRITLNLCRDHLKSPARRERPGERDVSEMTPQADAQPLADTRVLRRQRAQRVQRALATLRTTDREILVLKDLQELSYIEIAEMTGDSVPALKIRAVRARKRLKDALEKTP